MDLVNVSFLTFQQCLICKNKIIVMKLIPMIGLIPGNDGIGYPIIRDERDRVACSLDI